MNEPNEWTPEGEKAEGTVDYSLVWRFLDGSKPFTLGVEAGIIYERMQRREATVSSTTHGDNEEELRNLAQASGYRATFENLDDEGAWQSATFTRDGNGELAH
jgi:hypothetical protein